jgi:hypothetical protein
MSTSLAEPAEDPVLAVRRLGQGRTVTLGGFENYSGTVYLQSQSLANLKASIQKYVQEWFGLCLLAPEPGNDATADIVISDESAFLDPARKDLLSPGQVLLILSSKDARRDLFAATMDSDRIIELVNKPCGPRRLARALLTCFDKEINKSAKSRTVTRRNLDAIAPKARPKSFPDGTTYEMNRFGELDTPEKVGRATGLQSTAASSSPAAIPPSPGTNNDSKTPHRLSPPHHPSPTHSSSSDSKSTLDTPADSSRKTSTGSGSGSGNDAPCSSSASASASASATNASASRKISREASNADLGMAGSGGVPLARRKMLLVEVRNPCAFLSSPPLFACLRSSPNLDSRQIQNLLRRT